ncbi:MAG TPA: hypothetical protein VMH00_13060 [Candidatus Limnocylindrales bacterium]|nr:hypothetical protein [Candidatus Limnocylindrales bacterium]
MAHSSLLLKAASQLSYRIFGLCVSSNEAIPGLEPSAPIAEASDVEIHLGSLPHAHEALRDSREILIYRSRWHDEAGRPELQMWRLAESGLLRIDCVDGTQFWIDGDAQHLWATWPQTLTLEDAASYLLGPILGILLRFRGITCLHASAVAFGDLAAAFVGPPGSGKSTTAAAFVQRGHAVLSDDIVALVERRNLFCAVPSYPHISLWPESVGMLFGDSDALPHFTPDWEKRRLALRGNYRFETRELPLAAIYLLGPRTSISVPRIEPLDTRTALMALLPETYATNILDAQMRASEFEVLGRLVNGIPIRRLSARDESAGLQLLCDHVLADFRTLTTP